MPDFNSNSALIILTIFLWKEIHECGVTNRLERPGSSISVTMLETKATSGIKKWTYTTSFKTWFYIGRCHALNFPKILLGHSSVFFF